MSWSGLIEGHKVISLWLLRATVGKKKDFSQNKDYKGIEIKTITLENDPVNLRLFEAFYKPTLNSREECIAFADLLL